MHGNCLKDLSSRSTAGSTFTSFSHDTIEAEMWKQQMVKKKIKMGSAKPHSSIF